MAVTIKAIIKNSPAAKKRIKPNSKLISINNNNINDFLDYDFYSKDTVLNILIKTDNNKEKLIKIKKKEDEDLGFEFETYLMDSHKSCKNKCIFCFIDQLPKGMRESLYFKDDDSRLSFLFGNYITLTNLKDEDIDRIIKMRISPINISVHTTNPQLRCEMMNNRFAGNVVEIIQKFSENNIKMNCQLVLCPDINDGIELKNSLNTLSKYYPQIESIACVPLGKTKFRDNLFQMKSYNKNSALKVLKEIEDFADSFKKENGTSLAFASDEFYLKAEKEIPAYDFYEEFKQIENGVGMLSSLKNEFIDAIKNLKKDEEKASNIKFSIATGVAAAPLINELLLFAKNNFANINGEVFTIINNFFGEEITVAGLITGKDLIDQLKNKDLGKRLFITCDMLESSGQKFLDDITLEQAENQLKTKIIPVLNDGYDLADKIMGIF
ncbi:MAG: DUF512 domain-containing protein [Clostridia bacterium]